MVRTAVVNVVATASLDQELDFCEMSKFKEIFHDSDVYGGRVAYFKTSDMEGRVSLFASGKMISVGTKSEQEASQELESAMLFLVERSLVKKVKLQPRTQNIVVTVDLERRVGLEELAENSKSIYEPEQFPGAILKIDEPCKASILIFASGKAVVTGLTNSNQIRPTVAKLEEILKATIKSDPG
jgi:transcription initiation factor TFIID TATA-box-binding protein